MRRAYGDWAACAQRGLPLLFAALIAGLALQIAYISRARAETAKSTAGQTMASTADAGLARAVAIIKAQKNSATAGPGNASDRSAAIPADSLAAHVTPSGHWQFANAQGEVITAAGADEVRRALATLRPDAGAASSPAASLLLTDEGASAAAGMAGSGGGQLLGQLPAQATLSLLVDATPYRLWRLSASDKTQLLLAQIRSHLWLEVSDPHAVREVVWQLDRKLDPAGVRLLSLEPGGPRTLAAMPKREGAGRGALPDPVDPYGLVKALPALRGQKILIVGRLDKDLLWYQPRTGAEQSVLLSDIRDAAASNDIALVLLDTRLARQPGERTWTFLKVAIPGFERAMQAATIGDFYNGLAIAQGQFVLRAKAPAAGRVRIEAIPLGSAATGATATGADDNTGIVGSVRSVGGVLQDWVSGLTGNVAPSTVYMDLRSRERQGELERRWLPGIPSSLQIGYAVLLGIGLAAWPMARRWWARIWPAEDRAEYASAFGYGAARAVRATVFALIFVPVVAVVAFPAHVVKGLGETLLRVLRRLREKPNFNTPAGASVGPSPRVEPKTGHEAASRAGTRPLV